MIENNIFSSTKIEGGHSWTIISRLGDILSEIETRYGERDKSFTILGVELTDTNNPRVWFPGNCKNVIIQIKEYCLSDEWQAIFQVAHEAIHCLNPTIYGTANYLEEGLATYFSIDYCKQNGHLYYVDDEKYTIASKMVEKLLEYDVNSIKEIRKHTQSLSCVDCECIMNIYPNFNRELALKLTTNFQSEQP